MSSARDLVRCWSLDGSQPAHSRLHGLLTLWVDAGELAQDTPGERNRRCLDLHRRLVGRDIEAQAVCPHCRADIEFVVPVATICEQPPAAAHVILEVGGMPQAGRFRLPRMADLDRLPRDLDERALAQCLADACRVEGEGLLPPEALTRLAEMFEQADPLAALEIALTCAECSTDFAVPVEPADLVAREIDRLVDRMLREVHLLASAYGWSEDQVLAIPAARRARYLAMVMQSARSERAVPVRGVR